MSNRSVTQSVATLAALHGNVQALPVSFAQRRFWILDQLDDESAAYTIPQALRIVGPLDVDALAKSFNTVIARHEALRTVFVLEGDEPVQVVLASVHLDLTRIDLRKTPDSQSLLQSLVSNNANASFDLATGPLIRASLVQLADTDFVLLVAVHHLVTDGWSMGLLFGELEKAYDAFSGNATPEWVSLPLQYADFAVWQRKVMNGNAATKQLAYWREQLAGLEPLELPTDFARPAALSVRGGKRELELSPVVVDGMRALARRETATPSMVFLAAFFALLHRYSGQDDFAVATITSGRLRAEVEPLIGLFVNTLAVRSSVRDDESFADLLRRVVQRSTAAQANQNIPFEHVVDVLKLPYDQSRAPVVQVCCQLLEGLGSEPRLPGVEVSRVPSLKQTSKFELTLMLHPMSNGGLRAVFEYASDLFEASTIDRMLSHYANMLSSIVCDANTLVGQLGMMSDAERDHVLNHWNHTTQPLPSWTVPDRVLAQAGKSPQVIAVRAGEHALTYAELAQQSAVLAELLHRSGVVAGSRVAVCVDRTPNLLVALLGVLRAGAAYVPIDASYPSDRISYVLGDAGVVAVVTDTISSASLPFTNLPVVRVDALNASAPSSFIDAVIDAESLAYVLYTSGSTGLPKGVMVPHRALANFLHSMTERPGLHTGDVVVAVTTLAFDIAGLELWLPLVVGAHIELASRETAVDGAQLAQLIQSASSRVGNGKCLLQATPATWRLLVESGWTGTSNLTMLCGGEGWPPGLAEQLLPRGAALWNVYGPTETTIWSSREHVTNVGAPSLGEPLANTTLFVFERGGEPAPPGVPGELCIGGAGLAHGYHNRVALTAERFIERAPFGRLYRTGDLVVRRGNGRLEYLGRLDDQVKLRGHRIELGEIEAVLSAQPEVSHAIVAVRAVGTPPEPQLVAYLVRTEPNASAAATVSGLLTARLRVALPSYMVPAIFVTLSEMPLTPNGKVDRRALPAPDASTIAPTEFVAPRTALEQTIAKVWQAVFARESIGVHDDFFALGGHSLVAMRVLARLTDSLPAGVTIGTLLGARTIAGLASAIVARRELAIPGAKSAERIVPRAPGASAPLSFAQELLWLYEQMTPGTAAYHLPMARRIRGALDIAALNAAFDAIVHRHEALRTAFIETDAGVTQVVREANAVAIEAHDLRQRSDMSRDDQAAALLKAAAVRPFELASGELLRVVIVRVAQDEHLLLVVVHHIAFDGASVGVLFRELTALYNARCAATVAELPHLPVQVSDYATWERTALDDTRLAPALAFWKEALAGAPAGIDLPTDFPRPSSTSGPGARFATTLSARALRSLRTLSEQSGVTPFVVLLSAFQSVLYRHSNQSDLVVGVPVAGRTRAETESLIGYLANTLALRANFEGELSFAELLANTRNTTLAAFDNATIPYEKLVRELRVGQPAESQTLFRVFFALQDASIAPMALGSATLESFGVDVGAAKFDLSLSLTELPEGIRAAMEYRSDLFREDTIARLLEHLETLLVAAAENSTVPVAELPLLADTERTLLLDTWNDTAVEYDTDATLVSLLETQCARTPDAIAVVDQSGSVTYQELNTRSSALAQQLRASGARAGVLIGVCAERSIDLVVALHAVVKSGAAYVPIDPEYPADRLAYMLEDSATPVILTQPHLAHLLPPERVLLIDSTRSDPNPVAPIAYPAPRADDPAYMIYTSGSTGRPKGALNAHRGIVNRLLWMQDAYALTPNDVVLQKTPFSFDVSVWEFFWPLITGARLVMAEPGGHKDPEYLARVIDEQRVTVIHFVPSMLRAFVGARPVGSSLASLRHVMASGEALSADLVPPFRRVIPNAALHNLYGPTECAVDVTHWTVPRDGEVAVVPIGKPIANTQMYVLDAVGAPTPVGVPGELHIGGVQVGLGYHNKPALSAEKFVPHHFSSSTNAHLYRTGDLARWNADGDIEYLGRLDFQVKIRGFRIELGEIEATLSLHEAVRESVVVARNAGSEDAQLVAYVVPTSASTTATVLREYLARSLPDYMVPQQFVVLDALPLSSNGKVDRRALPEPANTFDDSRPYVAPRNDIERVVADIWREMLEREQISVETPFFEVGGHSLLATRIVGKTGTLFRSTIPLRRFFESPTVAGMAATLVSLEAKPGQATVIAALLLKLQNMTPEEREQLRKNRADTARLANTTG